MVPTIDGGQADGGQLGKAVIDLASAGASPAAVPMIDGGKLTAGKPVIVPPVVPTCRACRRAAAVPVVPTLDSGKRAESGQAGHRPGKRRGFPAAVSVVPTIDAGKLTPASWSSCRPWCR